MSVDLLRQQSRWKEGLMEIRQIIANLVQQVNRDICFITEETKCSESIFYV